MVLKLNNNLFTTNRTVLKEFKTAGSKKKPVLLFREKIDYCDLMKYTFNWPKLSSLGKSEISRGQCTKNIIFLYFSNLGL